MATEGPSTAQWRLEIKQYVGYVGKISLMDPSPPPKVTFAVELEENRDPMAVGFPTI